MSQDKLSENFNQQETNETQVLNVFDSHFNIGIMFNMFNYPMFSSQF